MKSLEFYLRENRVFVQYQEMDFPLREFLSHPEGADLAHKIYLKIITDYRDHLPEAILKKDSKGEIIGEFIRKHFLKHDKTFDVVYFPESGLLKFNLEI